MTKQEHDLMILMFARMNQYIDVLVDALKSRGIWTGDDAQAFVFAAHADDARRDAALARAIREYRDAATLVGVALQKE